jgi:2-oxoglutarate ferredoxin oxidoreductase subunit beta
MSHVPIGIFRQVDRPTYDDLVREQIAASRESGDGDLAALLAGSDTWTVSGAQS